jgi:hypothetical protein
MQLLRIVLRSLNSLSLSRLLADCIWLPQSKFSSLGYSKRQTDRQTKYPVVLVELETFTYTVELIMEESSLKLLSLHARCTAEGISKRNRASIRLFHSSLQHSSGHTLSSVVHLIECLTNVFFYYYYFIPSVLLVSSLCLSDSIRFCFFHLIGVLGFDSRRVLGIFLFTASRTVLGPTQPRIQWVPGALSLGIKRPGREADHSTHLVPKSKNVWSYTSTPPIRLHGVVLS